MASRLILIHDALIDHAVNDRNGFLVGGHGRFLVAGIAGLDDILNFGAQQRTLAHFVLAGLFRLTGALTG